MKKRFLYVSLNILAATFMLVGIYLLIRPYYQNYRQRTKIDDILAEMKITQTDGQKSTSEIEPVKEIEVSFAPDAYKVDGEEWEDFAKPSSTEPEANTRKFVKVKAYGRLDIPSINFSMPIADNATIHSQGLPLAIINPQHQWEEKDTLSYLDTVGIDPVTICIISMR